MRGSNKRGKKARPDGAIEKQLNWRDSHSKSITEVYLGELKNEAKGIGKKTTRGGDSIPRRGRKREWTPRGRQRK